MKKDQIFETVISEFMPMVKKELIRASLEGHLSGAIAGLIMYAWWKDGVQYVGTSGTTLKAAIELVELEHKKMMKIHEDES
jgi:hypothetical protein